MSIVRFSRTNFLKVLVGGVAIMLAACLLALVGITKPAEAAFPGENGKIAFVSFRDGHDGDIFVMNADGSQQTNLTKDSWVDGPPAWSPDGTKIAFVTVRDGNNEIFMMNADGSKKTNITRTEAPEYGPPTWSPDGTKIAFVTMRDFPFSEIFVMNADGSDRTNLTDTESVSESHPIWSPDGTKIAFVRGTSGDVSGRGIYDIYTMSANGSNPIRLTDGPGLENHPDWSPDSAKIAFDTDQAAGPGGEIFVMNADGSKKTNITDSGSVYEFGPAWSPDGTKIAYSRDPTGNIGGNWDIYTMNHDGSKQTNLTDNSPTDDYYPDWQPLPSPGPETKADCKKGGWRDFGFKNQGQCIKAVKNAD